MYSYLWYHGVYVRSRMVFLHDWEWEIVKRSGHDGCEVIVARTEDDQSITTQPGKYSITTTVIRYTCRSEYPFEIASQSGNFYCVAAELG